MTGRERLEGAEALRSALSGGRSVVLVLAARSGLPTVAEQVLEQASGRGVAVRRVSASVLRRFSSDSSAPAGVLAMVGHPPTATLEDLMARPGDVWLLAGLSYPGNVGGALRSLEVAGAAGVVVDSEFEPAERRRALRASMRADRLFPVLFEETARALTAARTADRLVVALETSGDEVSDELRLPERVLFVAGGERDGLGAAVLAACDRVLALPTRGFIPSFNVQVAIAMAAARRLPHGADPD